MKTGRNLKVGVNVSTRHRYYSVRGCLRPHGLSSIFESKSRFKLHCINTPPMLKGLHGGWVDSQVVKGSKWIHLSPLLTTGITSTVTN